MRRAIVPTHTMVGLLAACLLACMSGCMSAVPPIPPPAAPTTPAPQSAMRDFDADGFADPLDRCPREAGIDPHGCPPPDSDHDGIRDPDDRCPATPETRNGFDDLDGCIDEIPPELTAITGVLKGLEFDTDKPGIRPKSHKLLDRVAGVLTKYPDVRIELAGHVDSRGVTSHTGQLSKLRADAVRDYLAGHGVDASRIETRGADANEPLASNKSASGRARNRRVELTLLPP
jgi:outer membrane protein OmpA-like peptidoglycan-associated protein